MKPQSPYAARPWLRHDGYWVRPNLSYPGARVDEDGDTSIVPRKKDMIIVDIIAFCRQSPTEYTVPRVVEIRETLSMSVVGTILYRVLRDEHAATFIGQP